MLVKSTTASNIAAKNQAGSLDSSQTDTNAKFKTFLSKPDNTAAASISGSSFLCDIDNLATRSLRGDISTRQVCERFVQLVVKDKFGSKLGPIQQKLENAVGNTISEDPILKKAILDALHNRAVAK